MQNEFTFVIPVHNGLPYIKECIESILNQDYQYFNIVVLENASDDGTKEYLYSLTNPKVQIIESDRLLCMEENWGRIIQAPRNEFMLIVCADDVFQENYLVEINKLINEFPDASIYRTKVTMINEKSEVIAYPSIKRRKYSEEDYLKVRLKHDYFETIMGYCFRSKDYDEIGGIDCVHSLLHPDDVMVMKLARKSYLAVSKEYACFYRSHSKSTSTNPNPDVAINGYNYFFNWIYEQKKPILNDIVKKYLPIHNHKIRRFFNDTQIEKLEEIYPIYNINKNNFYYKFSLFLTKLKEKVFVKKECDRIALRFFNFKTYIRL